MPCSTGALLAARALRRSRYGGDELGLPCRARRCTQSCPRTGAARARTARIDGARARVLCRCEDDGRRAADAARSTAPQNTDAFPVVGVRDMKQATEQKQKPYLIVSHYLHMCHFSFENAESGQIRHFHDTAQIRN